MRLVRTVRLDVMQQVQSIRESVAARTIRRIAHPTNFSTESENGLSWAIQLAQEYHAELLVLHVLPPPTPLFELESPMKFEAELALSVLLEKLQIADIKARGFLLTGTNSIDGQIVRAARLEHVDLIIMGTRGRTGLSRLFLGSLASRVITRAQCPVLVIPSRQLSKSAPGSRSGVAKDEKRVR
jgi:nucleotide-binding universal stress UspA family protein